jgi:hypothetical protein
VSRRGVRSPPQMPDSRPSQAHAAVFDYATIESCVANRPGAGPAGRAPTTTPVETFCDT